MIKPNPLREYDELQLGDFVGDTQRMVLMRTKVSERVVGDCYASWVVIGVKITEYHPYVVWTVVATSKGFFAERGDYFFGLGDALKGYEKRGGRITHPSASEKSVIKSL
jgi:hypothetical protein